jgi:hypothetical protein
VLQWDHVFITRMTTAPRARSHNKHMLSHHLSIFRKPPAPVGTSPERSHCSPGYATRTHVHTRPQNHDLAQEVWEASCETAINSTQAYVVVGGPISERFEGARASAN